MKNLDQIRAANALESAPTIETGAGEGDPQAVAKKVPTMIKENGLIATAAFARDGKKGIQSVINAIEKHLKHKDIAAMPADQSNLLSWLTGDKANSLMLRAATDEAMAYLNYLRRFVEKKKDKKNAGKNA